MPVTDLIATLDGVLRDVGHGIDPEVHHTLPILEDWICLRDGQVPRVWGLSNGAAPTGVLTGAVVHIAWDSSAVRAVEGWYRLGRHDNGPIRPTPPSAPRARLSLPAFHACTREFVAAVERMLRNLE